MINLLADCAGVSHSTEIYSILFVYLQLKVTTVDGRPIKGEKVTIKADSNNGKVYQKVFAVNNGIVDFTINVGDATYLSINVRVV